MIIREAKWRLVRRSGSLQPPPQWRHWLTDSTSLTKRLRHGCGGQFHVVVLAQGWQRPLPSERRLLKLAPHSLCWTRQVHLFCGQQPLVFARTLIPRSTLKGELRQLALLGSRPLGELLFSHRAMRRGEVEIAAIQAGQHLFATALGTGETQPPLIWGRRCLFWLANKPLLVNEIFLPAVAHLGHRRDGNR